MSRAVSGRTYALVWVALMTLAALSFGLSYAPLGAWGPWVAIVIAVAKAVLIAGVFMHLIEQPPISRWTFGLGLGLALLLLTLVAIDVATRDRPVVPGQDPFTTPAAARADRPEHR